MATLHTYVYNHVIVLLFLIIIFNQYHSKYELQIVNNNNLLNFSSKYQFLNRLRFVGLIVFVIYESWVDNFAISSVISSADVSIEIDVIVVQPQLYTMKYLQ